MWRSPLGDQKRWVGLTLLIYPLQLTDLERMCKGWVGCGGVCECGVHYWMVRRGGGSYILIYALKLAALEMMFQGPGRQRSGSFYCGVHWVDGEEWVVPSWMDRS